MTTTIALIDLTNLTVDFAPSQNAANASDLYVATGADDLTDLTGPQAVAIYNATAAELANGLTEVKRFADKATANKRVWANITDLRAARAERQPVAEIVAESIPGGEPNRFQLNAAGKAAVKEVKTDLVVKVTQTSTAPAKKAAGPRRGTGINLAPQKKVYACREGSKQATLVDMLFRKQGATMAELLEALAGGAKPWKEVTVKSGLNWDMNKIKGYGIKTTKRGDDDCYHLVLPTDMTAPVPHTPRKGA